jgi:hypothetical protein
MVGKVEKAGEQAATFKKIATGAGGKPDVNPGATDQTDWKALLQTTLETFEKYVKGNQSIAAVNKSCLTSTRYLTRVIEGKAGDDPRATADGKQAEKFQEGAAKAKAELAFKKGDLSAGSASFAQSVAKALDGQDRQKIQQDIAIKWISGLGRDQVGAIDDADGYLKQIGVIDKDGNRLGVNTGSWTTEWDTLVIRARAQVEQKARAMVGSVRPWQGGRRYGDIAVIGSVQGDTSQRWRASGPLTLKEEAGGQVRVVRPDRGGGPYRPGSLPPRSHP